MWTDKWPRICTSHPHIVHFIGDYICTYSSMELQKVKMCRSANQEPCCRHFTPIEPHGKRAASTTGERGQFSGLQDSVRPGQFTRFRSPPPLQPMPGNAALSPVNPLSRPFASTRGSYSRQMTTLRRTGQRTARRKPPRCKDMRCPARSGVAAAQLLRARLRTCRLRLPCKGPGRCVRFAFAFIEKR